MEEIEFRAMGSRIFVALEQGGSQAQEALSQVPGWFERWEEHFSRFRSESELSVLNERAGNWVRVSPLMWDLLLASRSAQDLSGGLVTPALQGVLAGFGYDRSFELVATVGQDLSVTEVHASALPGMQIEFDEQNRRVLLPEGTQLDFGGLAKGWAADRTLQLLNSSGAALVDAGGDIATGEPADPLAAWPVGVTDPIVPQETLALLALRGEAVATSGRDVHRWQDHGIVRHHIIDPRTALPTANRVLTATVIAPSAFEAEVGAKCALILGEVEGLAWLDARPEYAGILALDDGSFVQSREFDRYLWSN